MDLLLFAEQPGAFVLDGAFTVREPHPVRVGFRERGALLLLQRDHGPAQVINQRFTSWHRDEPDERFFDEPTSPHVLHGENVDTAQRQHRVTGGCEDPPVPVVDADVCEVRLDR